MNRLINENTNNKNMLYDIFDKHIFNINNKREQIFVNINLNNFNHNINLKTMFIRIINNKIHVHENLSTRTFIKAINDFKILIIKTINNDHKRIKIIKKTFVSRY